MAHVVDTIDGHGPSNEKHRELQPMKTKVMLHILPVYIRSRKVVLPAIHCKHDRAL